MEFTDNMYIERALELGEKGAGWTSPNPLVGGVLVKDGKIIGEGYHHQRGKAHAEVLTIANARRRGHNPRGATMYLSLEPCVHQGKTPPCVDAIIEAGIKRVVYSVLDPNPLVSGAGAVALRRAGIEVESGIMAEEATYQNRIFFHWIQKRSPYVCVKVAVSRDGKITRGDEVKARIGNITSHKYIHAWRQRFDAILVGANTLHIDDPRLTVRMYDKPKDPLRVVLDSGLEVSKNAQVFADKNCLVLTTKDAPADRLKEIRKKAEVIQLPATKGLVAVDDILQVLKDKGISGLLVVGGQRVLTTFFKQPDKVQEWIIVRSQESFHEGLDFIENPDDFSKYFTLVRTRDADADMIEYYRPV